VTVAHSGPTAAWRKSSFCESNSCIEVSQRSDGMSVRNTDDPDPVLQFSRGEWNHFITALNSGTFHTR
jgi:hypothetical protein